MNKPNILFVFSDQQRWDTLGCYGQKLPVTPNLDALSGRGVLFRNAFTCQPVCGPARSCVQTGKYATETGCYRNNIALPAGEKTIAHCLSENGYETGYIGKWHLASTGGDSNEIIGEPCDCRTRPVPPARRGGYMDYWLAADVLEFTSHGYDGHLFDDAMNRVDFNGYRVDCLTDFAIEYLKTRDQRKPFFLFLSYIEPHHQNDHGRVEGPEGSREKFRNYEVPGDLADTGGDWRENYPDYLGCCASLDENVGRIVDTLQSLGMADNTVVFYTSDHGCHFRTRNSEYKRSCHESSIHIPMIAWGPGFQGGRTIDGLVSLIDIPPTLLACAGIEKPGTMRGKPLQELLRPSDVTGWPEEIFIQISERQVGRAIRTKRWKYSVQAPGKHATKDSRSDLYMEDFLYDL